MRLSKGFPPIIYDNSQILFLGSFPSLLSIENQFYYGNKRNQFWKIMEDIFLVSLETVDEKKTLLQQKYLALWDMVHTCYRKNSSDNNLKVAQINDIPSLLELYPNIKSLFFTGQKAFKIYQQNYSHLSIDTVLLPSPSPANQKTKYQDKVDIYKKEMKKVLLSGV